MTEIIKLTDAAVLHINNMIAKQDGALGFRVSIKKTGCSGYAYVPTIVNEVIESDLHFTVNQLAVYVDANSVEFLKNVVIDYVEDAAGLGLKQKRLVFNNPNEKNRCGCGESFTIE